MSPTRTDDPGVAVLGCGAWGTNHLRVWAELGALRAACDTRPSALDAVAAAHPAIALTASIEEILARDDIDAVVVATPAATHADLAARALAAGKDVLVEKPLALRVQDAEMLVDLAAKRSAVLMVGHVVEFHPAFVKLADLVRNGQLGRILYVYANRLNFGRVRTEESALWSFAPHDLAVLLRLVGSMPAEVACHGGAYLRDGVADVTMLTLTFPAGTRAHVFVSWLHPFKEHRFIVVGDKQMAIVDDTAPWPEKLLLYAHTMDWTEGQVPVAQRALAEAVDLVAAEPLRIECQHFLECIRSRRAPLTDGTSGLAVLRLLEAGDRSLRAGGVPVAVGAGPSEPMFHPTAIVDRDAHVGPGTRVWHFSHVMSGAVVGRDCVLGQNTFIAGGALIGDRTRIQNNVSVYDGVELEDDVFCGPSTVFTNVTNPRAEVDRRAAYEKTLVRRGATLGANSTVVPGVTVGRWAFVGAGAVVTRDVPDHALVLGAPARVVGWRCRCGAALDIADGVACCGSCPRRYRKDGDGLGEDEG